jgi:hypothetical protein
MLGRLEVSSQPGDTVFTLVLPLADDADLARSDGLSRVPVGAGAGQSAKS